MGTSCGEENNSTRIYFNTRQQNAADSSFVQTFYTSVFCLAIGVQRIISFRNFVNITAFFDFGYSFGAINYYVHFSGLLQFVGLLVWTPN